MLTWKKIERSPQDRGLDSPAFLAKLDQTLGESLKSLEDGVLRVVKFHGADFNDAHVDQIESVPNAAELCRDLRELRLMGTRIKPPAVERLRRLLPHVDVQVLVYTDNVGWLKK